jgi:hypothetical protein
MVTVTVLVSGMEAAMQLSFFGAMFLILMTGGGAWAAQTSHSAESSTASNPLQADGNSAFLSAPQIEDASEGGSSQVFLRESGSNFTPRDRNTPFVYSGSGCMQRNSNVGDSWFSMNIQLPHGAEIDFLRVYFYDNHSTYDINSELWAFDGAGGTTLIAEADSSGSPGFSSAGSDFFSHFVDNLNESLVVVASIQGGVGGNLQLCGIRIRYQAP